MMTGSQPAIASDAGRYEALVRLSGSLASRTPGDLARNLADELRSLLDFDFIEIVVYKEGTSEVLWQAIGTGQAPRLEIPKEETISWWVYQNQQPLTVADWNEDGRFSAIKNMAKDSGFEIRSFCRLPLTTSHHRLGVLGIASLQPHVYSEEEIRFLSLLAEILALSIENSLNSEALHLAKSDLQDKNTRLKLLLDLTNGITSNLELHELLRAIASNLRQVMQCDSAGISLPDAQSGKYRLYALDFPASKGLMHEELLIPRDHETRLRALETLKPVIENQINPADYGSEAHRILIGEGIKASCSIPLVSRGKALGLLGLGRVQENSFTEGDAEFLVQVAGQIAIAVENALAYEEISHLKDKLAQEKLYLEEEIRSEMNFEHVLGKSPSLKHVLKLVETVAPTDSTVLLLGETGTGKELIARAIHDNSRRKNRTFVKLNCAAIPTGLLESELFGHEKGAFTGAIVQRIGRLELADQGTLFLDEVGDIPAEIQPKLLRALQEREFERLGSTHTKTVDVRVVAATNRDLEAMIAAQEFRADLYYRLNVFPIRIPPLRERREDIELLVRYFVQKFVKKMRKDIETVPATAMKILTNWSWPGNIRELENLIERAVILTRGKALEVPVAELSKPRAEYSTGPNSPDARAEIARIVRETITEINKDTSNDTAKANDEKHRREITRILRQTRGRIGGADGAAARMALNRTTLISRMKKLGINPREFS